MDASAADDNSREDDAGQGGGGEDEGEGRAEDTAGPGLQVGSWVVVIVLPFRMLTPVVGVGRLDLVAEVGPLSADPRRLAPVKVPGWESADICA